MMNRAMKPQQRVAITVPADKGERVAVEVLRSFRAITGQEYMPGWIAGFSTPVAAELVRAGLAKLVEVAPAPVPVVTVPGKVPAVIVVPVEAKAEVKPAPVQISDADPTPPASPASFFSRRKKKS